MDPTLYPLLPQAALAFPNIDPVLIQVGPIALRWYSLGYIVGIVIGWWLARRMAANDRLWGTQSPIRPVDIDDFVLWATIGIIVGGRLGYVLFYDLGTYIDNPLGIFATWQGGMSFHGGLIGTALAMLVFARRRGIDPWRLFDVVAAVAPIGIGLVRIANFINAELYGRVSEAPWAMVFPTDPLQLPRHPSQLYEALLEGLVLFVVLRLATHRWLALRRPRFVSGLFIAGYGTGRTVVEFFREPDAHIGFVFGGWLTMGMVLSIPMILLGLALIASAPRAEQPRSAA
ncbi:MULTISPECIES: prolipoprotein diacylglyceryl transferase [unclassified Roseitalea]|uniref:prolipoprotein diacylglyceryl transferase n=1 Tax=unclassified Roseitalea TaxID=2639107 RepID=UPI00273E3E0E|nr:MULTISPECIES: prolipoprotein diacylglyceryl transferase [unclassified Roseitalea]